MRQSVTQASYLGPLIKSNYIVLKSVKSDMVHSTCFTVCIVNLKSHSLCSQAFLFKWSLSNKLLYKYGFFVVVMHTEKLKPNPYGANAYKPRYIRP